MLDVTPRQWSPRHGPKTYGFLQLARPGSMMRERSWAQADKHLVSSGENQVRPWAWPRGNHGNFLDGVMC